MDSIRLSSPILALLVSCLAGCGGGTQDSEGEGTATGAAAETAPPVASAMTSTAEVSPRELYVATTGLDTNPGTQAAPFRTISKASSVAQPGTTVHVAAGTYPGSFQTAASGTAAARVRYVSDVKWAARIVPPAVSNTKTAWANTGDYVDIVGFEVDGTLTRDGVKWMNGILTYASHNFIAQNKVHHIANASTDCQSEGGSGINATSWKGGYHDTFDGNTVYAIGVAGCQFIHGIYMSTSGQVTNNLVYQIGYGGIHLYHDAYDVDVANNTVFATHMALIVASGGTYHRSGPTDYIRVVDNIFYDNHYGAIEMGQAGPHNRYLNNLSYKNTYDWALDSLHAGDVTADPQFVNYVRAGGGDYRLRATSPAVDAGIPYAGMPAWDNRGFARFQGAQVDLGAYENR